MMKIGTAYGEIVTEGVERDWEMRVDRHISEVDVGGAAPKLIPLFPSQATDEVSLSMTAWVTDDASTKIRNWLPPYNVQQFVTLSFLGLSGIPAIPGFGLFASDYWVLRYVICESATVSHGRKAPRVGLFGYQFKFKFAANAYGRNGSSGNERNGTVPTSTTVPDLLASKFASDQIQDAAQMFAPLPIASAVTKMGWVGSGRRDDCGILFDHLSHLEVESLVNWFRAIRGATFSFTNQAPFGTNHADTENAKVLSFEAKRSGGWFDANMVVSRVP